MSPVTPARWARFTLPAVLYVVACAPSGCGTEDGTPPGALTPRGDGGTTNGSGGSSSGASGGLSSDSGEGGSSVDDDAAAVGADGPAPDATSPSDDASAGADATSPGDDASAGADATGPSEDASADARASEAGTDSGSNDAGGGTTNCTEPPQASALVGWASQPGAGYGGTSIPTTTGGGSAKPVTVTTLAALNTAAAGTTPAVIYVKGVFPAGTVKVGSNKTIAGICGAELHGHVDMSGSVNVIFRNLKVVGYNCSDVVPASNGCKTGADAITVISGAHHIWFDHDDISDGSDGNLDITNGSDLVTVSWTKFHYSTMRTDPVTGSTGHRFSNLIGAADGLAIDVGHLNITWDHDWWADNVAERMPRSRDGKIHVVNCLFTAAGNDYCTNSGNLSSLLVENNVYVGVNNPLQEDADGNMLARGNVFTNTTGSKTSMGTGFTPPYSLTPASTTNLEATIQSQAGPR
jgi:pectate lyase